MPNPLEPPVFTNGDAVKLERHDRGIRPHTVRQAEARIPGPLLPARRYK